MRPIEELTRMISEFPGLGPRQARRVVQFLLSKDQSFVDSLTEHIKGIKREVVQCATCFRYDDAKTNGTCTICRNPNRDHALLMVVEKDVDIEGVEASGAYNGLYFVLGGLMPLSPRKNTPYVRSKELLDRITKNGVTEVIFALSTTPEGDFTARELSGLLKTSLPGTNLTLSLLGRGLSVGAEIEYADTETLRNALQSRSQS